MAIDAESRNPAQSGRGDAEIPIHPLVTKLLGESGEPQQLVTMVGYIGPSKKEAHVRLYTGLDFQTYYEVPREKVALAEPVDREDDNGPTQLMIQADATVDLVQTSKQTGPASYLAGGIAGTYLAGAAAGQAAVAIPFPTRHTVCYCFSAFATQCICTRPPACIVRTSPLICPVASGFACPAVSLGCPEGPGGGPVEAQAQAPMYVIPQTALCPSVGIPCHSQGFHCPPPVTSPDAAAPQAAVAPNLGWPSAFCSYFGGCGPHGTHNCPQAQVGTPQAAALQAAVAPNLGWPSAFCSYFGGCGPHGTHNCPQAQVGAPQVAIRPSAVCFTHLCSVVVACTVHHGCPTAAVVC